MEFSYKLTESDYLRASIIAVNRPKRRWARALSYGYLTQLFLVIWGALIAGMMLERSDMVGITAADLRDLHVTSAIIPASIVPSAAFFGLVVLLLRLRFLRWFISNSRRENFRVDPACQAATTVTVTPQSIAFRSALGSSESDWRGYSAWAEKDGILLLVTHAGVRKILKISALSDVEKSELLSIVASALQKK